MSNSPLLLEKQIQRQVLIRSVVPGTGPRHDQLSHQLKLPLGSQKNLRISHFKTQLFRARDTLGNLAPEGQEVQSQKWHNFEEQRHRRAFAQTGSWVRKKGGQDSPTKTKAGSKRGTGIVCSLAEWAWWGIRWANRDQVPCRDYIWTISTWTSVWCLCGCFYVFYLNFS